MQSFCNLQNEDKEEEGGHVYHVLEGPTRTGEDSTTQEMKVGCKLVHRYME